MQKGDGKAGESSLCRVEIVFCRRMVLDAERRLC